MLVAALLLVAAPDASPAPEKGITAERQALAIVRILPGAQLKFTELERDAPERLRDTQVRGSDGSSEPARLVEFQ